jgi:uroporphyrinogen decarboxylase
MGIYDDPQLIKDTVKFFIEMQSMWGLAQIEAGADALWFGDCNASGHLISVDNYMEFAFDAVKQCAKEYDKAGAFTFYHASEHNPAHMKAQAATGISALSVGPGVDMAVAKQAVGDKVCLMGNVDPINILLYGTPEQVYEESKRIMNIGKRNGGYLFNSGEMIPRAIPEENMNAMIRAGKEFGGAEGM